MTFGGNASIRLYQKKVHNSLSFEWFIQVYSVFWLFSHHLKGFFNKALSSVLQKKSHNTLSFIYLIFILAFFNFFKPVQNDFIEKPASLHLQPQWQSLSTPDTTLSHNPLQLHLDQIKLILTRRHQNFHRQMTKSTWGYSPVSLD